MSGYPPIPRDPSGAPLPVVWDDGLQSWKVYEGLMPLETKLAAIESKLLALDSKFADGSAKVALSGNIVLIGSVVGNTTVTAGSTLDIAPEAERSEYLAVGVTARKAAVNYNHRISVQYRVTGGSIRPATVIDESSERYPNGRAPLSGNFYRVEYRNLDTSDHIINEIYAYGIRG